MTVARIAVGLAALLIVAAGVGWYLVDLFSVSPVARKGPVTARALQPAGSRPSREAAQFQRRQRRRTLALGAGAIAGGLVLIPESLTAIRTGTPIHMLNGPAIEGHVALAAFVFVIVLGVAVIGSAVRNP